MPARLRNLFLFIVLIVAAAATWLLRPAEDTENPSTGTGVSERGFYILEAIFSGLDETGKVVYRLAAARIEGSQSSEQMSFHEVEISYGQDQEIPWEITAQSARRRADGNIVELTGVIIESISDGSEQITRIEAETLELEPDRQLASTSGPVRFIIGDNRIDAVGLTADLRNEQISLESRVSGRVAQ
jgi:LPS export ABC transporter protein LptC